jgi:hypothetical protein
MTSEGRPKVIKISLRARRDQATDDSKTDSRARRVARWMNAYTLAAFNPVHPYRRPTTRP